MEIAGQLQKAIESAGIEHHTSRVKPFVTLSIGVAAVVPARDSSVDKLVDAADRALYRAKESGRNRIETD